MASFALSAFLLATVITKASLAFCPQSLGPVRLSSFLSAKRNLNDDDETVFSSELNIDSYSQSMTAREARIVAPTSAAFATISLGSTAAIAAEGGTGSFESSIREYFPGAMPNSAISGRVLAALKKRNYTPDSTLFGASICSDEINSTPDSIAASMQKGLSNSRGGMFNLGGLGGLPFVGKSGFGAFFSHCPVDGKIVILYGPHVGISQTGVVGKVERVGMSKPSTACGAGIGAYKALMSEKNGGAGFSLDGVNMDNQEEWIVKELSGKFRDDEYSSTIGNGFMGNSKMAMVTYKTYDLVWDLMKKGLDISVTNPEFWEKVTEVTLLGGIIINQGHYKGSQKALIEDYFQPFSFQSWRAQDDGELSLVKEDLFKSTFQMKNPKKELGL